MPSVIKIFKTYQADLGVEEQIEFLYAYAEDLGEGEMPQLMYQHKKREG
jgi:hypothetical protein